MIFVTRSYHILSVSRPRDLLWNTPRIFIHFPSRSRETIICVFKNKLILKAPSKERNPMFEMPLQEMVAFTFQS